MGIPAFRFSRRNRNKSNLYHGLRFRKKSTNITVKVLSANKMWKNFNFCENAIVFLFKLFYNCPVEIQKEDDL